MKNNVKYIALMVGADARTDPRYQYPVLLRKTKRYYITSHSSKFKHCGRGVGTWPLYDLINIERKRTWHLWRHMWE